MLNDNAKKFIAALRSGNYKQTKGVLHKKGYGDQDDCFCVLGVACDVAAKNGLPLAIDVRPTGSVTYNGVALIHPSSVDRWLGLHAASTLMGMNDEKDMTFEEIANELESNPEKYFA